MSSTGNLKRTERIALPALNARMATIALATLVLAILLVSFRPFQPLGAAGETGGDIVNQLGFSALGGISILGMLMLANPRTLLAVASPWWLVLAGFVLLSALNAPEPAAAIRSVIFTFIGIVCVLAVLCLPRDADSFSTALAVTGGAVLVLSYAGLVLLPDVAMHSAFNTNEPEHAGLWRGIFSHKNVAGPVMARFVFAGIYLMRRRWFISGGLIALAALFFVAHTGSKTATALVPLVVLLVTLPGIFGLRSAASLVIGGMILFFFLITLGTVLFEPLATLFKEISPDPTFTGRTAIWQYAIRHIAEQPWTGYGFESFWSTPVVTEAEAPYYLDWDIRGAVHGHNGYIDIALSMGLPALACTIIVLIILPLIDYARCRPRKENVFLADFFMMVLAFSMLNAFLESFFFRRVDPVWLMLVMAVLGLRLTARQIIATRI